MAPTQLRLNERPGRGGNGGPSQDVLDRGKVFHLPLLIVREDNRYASTTATRGMLGR